MRATAHSLAYKHDRLKWSQTKLWIFVLLWMRQIQAQNQAHFQSKAPKQISLSEYDFEYFSSSNPMMGEGSEGLGTGEGCGHEILPQQHSVRARGGHG